MRAVIMAGGKGTRLSNLTKGEIPKPMLKMGDKPILEHQIIKLRSYGIDHVTLIIGHLGDKIKEYFGKGEGVGIPIEYVEEREPLGTAGALCYLGGTMEEGEDFILVMGDIFFDVDLWKMMEFHNEKNAFITLLAHPNIHPYDSDLVVTDREGRVTAFDSKHNDRSAYWYDNLVNAGIFVVNSDICEYVPRPEKLNLEKDLIANILEERRVFAYRTPEYVRDIGTEDRVERTLIDMEKGLPEMKNLRQRQKCIFLDRDGVINVFKGFLYKEEMLEVYDYAAEAVKLINSSGYLVIVVSNQPVIARGECTVEELENIMNKMKTILGREGACLDDVFYCPHHPHKGFEGEIPELKTDCECRKPKTGMVDAAAEKYNIDLSRSWIIGDTTADMEMGKRAGMHTCGVLTGKACSDGKYDVTPEMMKENLLEAVKAILELEEEEK